MRAAAAAIGDHQKWRLSRKDLECSPAAAAGSLGLFAPAVTELAGDLESKGLRLRLLSESLPAGERDRLSNLEERFGSGSV